MEVLLVGDHLENQDAVKTVLREAGFSALFVNDGLSGLDAAIAEEPGLIVVDSFLVGIDMIDFVKKIRRRPCLANIPVFLLIQKEEDYDPLFLQSAGIQTTLNKPIDPALLSKEVVDRIAPRFREQTDGLSVSYEGGGEECDDASDAFETIRAAKKAALTAVNDELLRKNILEVIEKVLWEVLPGTIETALPKEAMKSMVERVVWETVPALAEIEIKKEIKRLQSDPL